MKEFHPLVIAIWIVNIALSIVAYIMTNIVVAVLAFLFLTWFFDFFTCRFLGRLLDRIYGKPVSHIRKEDMKGER